MKIPWRITTCTNFYFWRKEKIENESNIRDTYIKNIATKEKKRQKKRRKKLVLIKISKKIIPANVL